MDKIDKNREEKNVQPTNDPEKLSVDISKARRLEFFSYTPADRRSALGVDRSSSLSMGVGRSALLL